MARIVVERVVSDLSGRELEKDEVWQIELVPADGRKNRRRLDVAEDEIQNLLSKGQEIKRRGRRPGSTNKPKR